MTRRPPAVDLRSDTVTRPTAGMTAAMVGATVGDDVFGDDPTVIALQERVAALVGKEAALFVPSGTMANQLAVRAHCRSGDEVLAHARSHVFNYESGAAAALAGVQLRVLDSDDGSLPVEVLEASVHGDEDAHLAPTRLVCFENTQNGCGGVVVPERNVEAVAAIARARGLAMHLDGARLMNASLATGRPPGALAAPFDTVSLCFSKGLGAPVGSALCGSSELIRRAHRFRKMYGGGMRQAGILAAAGLYALEHHVERLADDHRRARRLAEALAGMPGAVVDLERVQTNLVYFALHPGHSLGRPAADGRPGIVHALAQRGVLITGSPARLRAVTHLDVDDRGLDRAIDALGELLSAPV